MSSTANAIGIMMPMQTQSAAAANVSSKADLKQDGAQASASFGNILNQVSDTVMQTRVGDTNNNMAKQPADTKNQTRDVNNASKNDAGTSKTDTRETADATKKSIDTPDKVQQTSNEEASVTETDGKLQKAIDEAGEKLVAEIAETFDLSEDDVIKAMEVLGVMAADLLNPQNLQTVVTELIGQDKALELITDSDLYTSLQDLLEGAEDMRSQLMNEFDISDEELQAAIDNNPAKDFSAYLNKDTERAPQVIVNEAGEELTKENAPQSKVTSEIREDVISEKAHFEENRPVEESGKKSDAGHNGKEGFNQDAGASNLFNQITQNIAEAVSEAPSSAAEYTDRAQMESIVRQITERITISAGADETSMELQLHPASLGNVNILLTSGKDGITARFTAQNELVKEAVESQMLQLQQKFDEQGIKVTSIEVTIASHAFEQNLDDQNQRQGYENEQSKGKKGPRRINLSQISDIDAEEELDDTDRLAAQMMAANGNTVDFSA